jgi:S1-C subfamily serine protease
MNVICIQRRYLLSVSLALGLVTMVGSAAAALSDTVARMKESVILVGTYSATDSPRFTFRGSGFVVTSGNLAVTNVHVLSGNDSGDTPLKQVVVQIWTRPNQWDIRFAQVVARDTAHDVALLSFDGPAVSPVKFTERVSREGDSIAFMGFPIGGALGFSHVTHRGTISSIAAIGLPTRTAKQLNERAIWQLRQGNFEIFQLDATAYPGNSGGPIFDPESGAVIGVVNSVLVKSTRESALSQPTGISYGIPIEHVIEVLQRKP